MSENIGRPRSHETRRRTHEMLGHVARGTSLLEAAREARVKPERVLRLLDLPEFLAVYVAIRGGLLGPTAAVTAFQDIDVEQALRQAA